MVLTTPAPASDAKNRSEAEVLRGDNGPLIDPLPLTPLELFLLQCAAAQSPMVIQVVLRLTGKCQPELYVQTLKRAIVRHPLFSCRIQQINRQWCWVADIPEPISICRRLGSVFELECGTSSKFIDLTTSAGLQISITVLDDGVKVYFDLHHAVSDGNGMWQLITDWFHLYHCEVTGAPAKLPVMDPDRLLHRHLFPKPKSIPPIGLKQAMINIWATIRGRTARWAASVQQDRIQQDEASSHCVEMILSDEQGDQLRERMAAWGVKLNELVMACLMSTFAQLAPAGSLKHQITVLNPIDLRMPSDRSLPASNRFGVAFMRRARGECVSPAAILRGLHGEMTWVRSNYIGVEFVKGLATAAKIPGGISFFRRLGLFIPSMQWTCLGDVSRGGKRLVPWIDGLPISGVLRLATATGFAPCAENVPASISTCEAGKTITLTVRSSPRFLSMDETRVFLETLLQQLCTLEFPEATQMPQNSQAQEGGTGDANAAN